MMASARLFIHKPREFIQTHLESAPRNVMRTVERLHFHALSLYNDFKFATFSGLTGCAQPRHRKRPIDSLTQTHREYCTVLSTLNMLAYLPLGILDMPKVLKVGASNQEGQDNALWTIF